MPTSTGSSSPSASLSESEARAPAEDARRAGPLGLVAAVVYHAINGLRIVFLDYRPYLWQHQQRAAYIVLAVTAIILVPVFILMFGHVLDFYGSGAAVD